jgi:L,D-transpeptidase-like protein
VIAALILVLLVLAPSSVLAAGEDPACEVRYPSDARVAWDCRVLGRGETVERLFGNRWADVLRFNRIDRLHVLPGVSLKVPRRLADVRGFTPMPAVYPEAAGESKFVLVDLTEQFLGAYEYGRLAFSSPLSGGSKEHPTPTGDFKITAAHGAHWSSLYTFEGTDIPYPMTWALRFHIDREGASFWIHGRDVPGYPASHGCIGLYDESMQRYNYGVPVRPVLDDARRLYEWIVGTSAAATRVLTITGPRLRIVRQPAAS